MCYHGYSIEAGEQCHDIALQSFSPFSELCVWVKCVYNSAFRYRITNWNLTEVIILKLHHKKMIAPIVVSVIMVLYYVVYFGFLFTLLDGIWKVVLGFIPLVFSAVTVKVCIERINEIRKGEEDDLSKY